MCLPQGASRNSSSQQGGESYALLVFSLVAASGGSFGFYFAGLGPALPSGAAIAGAIVAAAGMAVRDWAIVSLGRFFSLVVRTSADQPPVT